MYFITTKRMLEVCFSAHPNIQYRTENLKERLSWFSQSRQALFASDKAWKTKPSLFT